MRTAFWVAVDVIGLVSIVERLLHGPASGLSGRLINDGLFLTAGFLLGTWLLLAYFNYLLRCLEA